MCEDLTLFFVIHDDNLSIFESDMVDWIKQALSMHHLQFKSIVNDRHSDISLRK